ncbi:DUF1223 domain-containing protein [Candidatus Sumerlaeota bacterium]|nr:DUF1223 domain-containing protein [Candidatus Sumerlaeota bacterium]
MLAAILAIGLLISVANLAFAQETKNGVLIELFTSQGCSSCPPAEKLLNSVESLSSDAIPLAFHVDYWDNAQWRDPFSSADWTARQRAYQAQFKLPSLYTPQAVVAGRIELNGTDRRSISAALNRGNGDGPGAPAASALIRIAPYKASAASERPAAAWGAVIEIIPNPAAKGKRTIHAAIAEDDLSTKITNGENEGRVMRENHVVRRLCTAGEINLDSSGDKPSKVDVPLIMGVGWKEQNLSIVAFLQNPADLTIDAAAEIKLIEARAETDKR